MGMRAGAMVDDRTTEPACGVVALRAALDRIARVPCPDAIVGRAAAAACNDLGFARCAAAAVDAGRLSLVTETSRDADLEPFGALLDGVSLLPSMVEAEAVRRRRDVLVRPDAAHAGRSLLNATTASAYGVVPVTIEDRAVLLLVVDGDGAFDLLGTFATALGFALERERLRQGAQRQRRDLRAALAAADALLDDQAAGARPLPTPPQATAGPQTTSQIAQVLTRRELEVLELMAAGETNRSIAEALVVTEGTIKSHVKHILRKLRASNRAQAVSRYLRLAQLDR